MSTQNKRQRIWAKCSFVIDEIIVPLLISLGRIWWCKMRKRRSTSSNYSFLTDENKYKSSNVVGMNVVVQNELTSVLETDETITDKPRSRAGYSTDHRPSNSHLTLSPCHLTFKHRACLGVLWMYKTFMVSMQFLTQNRRCLCSLSVG